MVFNSYTFVIFFAIILGLHNLPISWKAKKINLLIASYLFYAAWNPPFILLLWLSTVVDFFVGRALYTQPNKSKRHLLLIISLIGNLGMLCFFKYGGFILENFVTLSNAIGLNYHPAKPNIILPAGISFYTFTTLCYTIDMYKKKSKPVKSLLDFSLFVTFFPHLVAGPIVRPPQLVPQFETPRTATGQQLLNGLLLLTLGLFMKVVCADTLLASTSDTVFSSPGNMGPLDAWAGVLAFSGQIFFDFAGYSTSAIGVALCLGFILPQNFLYPYAAIGFSDFWRRWHITLSSWLRDYLYIPLGGNREGKFRAYINVMITMLIGGLWHGANWTFVAWGCLHGFYLWIEKALKDSRIKKPHLPDSAPLAPVIATASFAPVLPGKSNGGFLYALFTFLLICVTWVFFRSATFAIAWRLLKSMAGQAPPAGPPLLTTAALLQVAIVVSLMLAFHWFMRDTTVLKTSAKLPWWLLGIVWALLLILIILSQGTSKSFIYFQF
ncbi:MULTISPECIES: MBOAT family O-acyltransferase [unclassified Mucilaginibacter]|uniref:MBOAT family O-acyltransferase n=1 Tax=unclassified Mucilaginibacter TaxID=2617802 RepID=UPI002AC9108B|nr:MULTISPECIES: MBOAT family O-acyltransferase [unclassified Mucilaginibacter]MEB0263184.1 MBOAT family O-acyltransferase [Mucilaginibacter sp. 10I4]MEB0280104.1 MBOAT family O-acyltransferase [Mucilaginibacter sp. 10B2]MEB0301060.1 MBOAT family O-acyltransferase [Mucilaginibacter sp. 5C4]WPX24487.1 MBOAT family O-acyltransferase [Mucilaginibacter sp. 5C4]